MNEQNDPNDYLRGGTPGGIGDPLSATNEAMAAMRGDGPPSPLMGDGKPSPLECDSKPSPLEE